MHKVQIITEGAGRKGAVWIDGKMLQGVRAVRFEASVDACSVVSVELNVRQAEVIEATAEVQLESPELVVDIARPGRYVVVLHELDGALRPCVQLREPGPVTSVGPWYRCDHCGWTGDDPSETVVIGRDPPRVTICPTCFFHVGAEGIPAP